MFHPDQYLPATEPARAVARRLYDQVRDLPLICPHGHTDPAWFARNTAFSDPVDLLVLPDHYVTRMLVSQGIGFDQIGIGSEATTETDRRAIWRLFAERFHLFRGTPTAFWLNHSFANLFDLAGLELSAQTADRFYDQIADCLGRPAYRPRALYDRFGIEVIATTDAALDDLRHHADTRASDWGGHVVPTYRPDDVIDPDSPGFSERLDRLGDLTGEDTADWTGYLAAHRARRAHFIAHGATASDHGHPTAQTADLSPHEAATLFDRIRQGRGGPDDHELFRAQMLTEMAAMSLEDGLVMQLHAGSVRNHHHGVLARYGRDRGFDIPGRTDFVHGLRPLLNRYGMDRRLRLILFTLDETTLSRELAPLAGVYPSVFLGPAWWFFDSAEGMRRFRQLTSETAGFYNTVGFNDDTRALPSIAARHDLARRIDCGYLAERVVEHSLTEDAAADLAKALSYDLAKSAYRF
ncbi:MAG: glucuronate isomerase [Marinibacterium sp.]|nr:glucuronate isomerase [Marinibacterium sp.]